MIELEYKAGATQLHVHLNTSNISVRLVCNILHLPSCSQSNDRSVLVHHHDIFRVTWNLLDNAEQTRCRDERQSKQDANVDPRAVRVRVDPIRHRLADSLPGSKDTTCSGITSYIRGELSKGPIDERLTHV